MDAHSANLLQESLALVDQALGTCAQMESENTQLRAKHAEAERVYLDKVAALQKPGMDPALVHATLRQLQDLSLIDPAQSEKIASELVTDPNQALHLLQRLVSLSTPAHQEGRAVEKSADDHAPSSDPDGWDEVRRKGAA